jgi:hypothetical protein
MLVLDSACQGRKTYLECCPYSANLATVALITTNAATLAANQVSRVTGPAVLSVSLPVTSIVEPDTVLVANETQHKITVLNSTSVVVATLNPGTTQSFTYQGGAWVLS